MYNYDFKKNNESLLQELNNVLIEANKQQEIVNILITEKSILFFYNLTNNNPLPPHYRVGMLPEYELIMKVLINDAKLYYRSSENFTEIVMEKGTIIIYNIDLTKYLK